MRLIDADIFKEYIMNGFLDAVNLFKTEESRDVARQMAEAICDDIDEQPTAYDVNKVVVRITEEAHNTVVDFKLDKYVYTRKVIEIVRAGGS